MDDQKHILLTNDDGVDSPGLWAAARALTTLGMVTVVAPAQQCTSVGRSMPSTSTGRIWERTVQAAGRDWVAYAVDGTPAQTVQHALLEIMPRFPDLVVSGINYGENVGSGVTISGTVGAALEAASFDLPALALSLETEAEYYFSHSEDVDFSAAAHFTHKFANLLLTAQWPRDVDVIKVEIPASATPRTPWRMTRQSRTRYFIPTRPARSSFAEAGRMGFRREVEPDRLEHDSDVQAMVNREVAVTPLSLDLTSRIDLGAFDRQLRNSGSADFDGILFNGLNG